VYRSRIPLNHSAGRYTVAVLLFFAMLQLLSGCSSRYRDPERYRSTPSGSRPSIDSGPLLLRIGLETATAAIKLIAEGRISVMTGDRSQTLIVLQAGDEIRVNKRNQEMYWSALSRSGSASSLLLEPTDPSDLILWGDDPFPGEIRILVKPDGMTMINIVELETYLRGVVPWEIGRTSADALSALEAQAIAARTYSVSHLGEREALGFDMWSSVMDQVYRGHRGLDDLCDQAIESTRGLVMQYKGEGIEAYYCSTCGGRTSNVQEVWAKGSRPYLKAHDDNKGGEDFCADSSQYRWTSNWSADQLSATLQKTLPEYMAWIAVSPLRGKWAGTVFRPAAADADPARPGALLDLKIASRTSSGRVGILEIFTQAGRYRVRGDRVRWVLKPHAERFSILRSAHIDLKVDKHADGRPKAVRATGRGFGHGIGMCQTGALKMARLGYSATEILKHYYPGVDFVKVGSE
jgi:stage II sporulation protein D (peptidoglycan lytic transglycosylase)